MTIVNVVRELGAALLLAWRRLLTTLVRGVGCGWARLGRAGERSVVGWRAVYAYLTDTASAWADAPPSGLTAAAAFGVCSFLAGLLLSVGVALGAGSRLPEAGIAAFIELLWAAARLGIVLLILPADSPRHKVLVAFAAGLIPYAIGLTPLLRLASLWLSAVLTSRGLRGARLPSPLTRSAVIWAFGGQAVVMLGSIVMRAVVALLSVA